MAGNGGVSKRTARTLLKVLFSTSDIAKLALMRVVLLSGLPGSGKSTIAELLATLYGFERLSTDDIRVNELFVGQEHRLGKQHDTVMASRYMVYEELGRRLAKSLAVGKRVVVDGTHLDDKRLMIVGAALSQVACEQVAFVISRPPEWIMRRRFLNMSPEATKHWFSVYKYWRKYMKDGKAAFPSEASFPRIVQIPVRRYSIRTFTWVPNIKAIVWDVDGTLYKDTPALFEHIEKQFLAEFRRATGLSARQAAAKFYAAYKKMGSKTMVLDSVGLDGRELVKQFGAGTDFGKFLKKDRRMVALLKSLSHVKQVILTNANVEVTRRKLLALGIPWKLFDEIIGTFETKYLKPDPAAFRMVVRKLGLKPEQVLAVGDREETDIVAAKKAGLKTAFVWGTSREADVSLPVVYEVAGLFGKEV